MCASYYTPRDNVFIETDVGTTCLVIPREQQRDDSFSYKSVGKIYHGKTAEIISTRMIDNPKDFSKWLVPSLKSFADLFGIPGVRTMRKEELLIAIIPRVIFE